MRRSLVRIDFLLLASGVCALVILGSAHAADSADNDTEKSRAESVAETDNETASAIETVNFQQPPPARPAQPLEPAAPAPTRPGDIAASLFGTRDFARSLLTERRQEQADRPGTDVVLGAESRTRPSTDAGSLLGKSLSASGVELQKRTPIITDFRSRGERPGQLLGSGSFWVPARLDLDTMLSKLDASIIGDMIIIKGPYSSRYGPGFSFSDIELAGSPRYEDGPEWHGRTSLNFQTNGEQWYGRQTVLGGSTDWGFRVGYGHRTGNDYETGGGEQMPASYISRDLDVAIGWDLSPDEHIEFSYLRLDQTGVEFPGQIFDIDFLVTDAFDVKYTLENQCYFDRLAFDAWYNRTRFEGNAQNAGKRRQIPQLQCSPNMVQFPVCFNAPRDPNGVLDFFGVTDVDSMSTGFRVATTWGTAECPQLTLGVDLRYIKQELNEHDSFQFFVAGLGPITSEGNFPIPRSHWADPGLFGEQVLPLDERLTIKTGTRVDWVSTNVEGRPNNFEGRDLKAELGSDDLDKEFNPWSAFVTADYKLDECLTASGGFGYAMRPPTLTELYADGPFLAILQQGFSFVTGNPELKPERLWQIDLGVKGNTDRFRGGISGFYAWIHDYITYEAIGNFIGVPTSLGVRTVNTDRATLGGGEVYGEYDLNSWLTPFARMSYVEGRDHTRDGRGRVPTIKGSDEEPLPGISPLESRLGLRFHEPIESSCDGDRRRAPRWGVELSARVVDEQDRVASSLLERATPGFTTWDVRSFWQATDRLLLIAGVENFTDKNYREHLDLRTGSGVFQPGVNFYFGAELSY